MVVYVTAAHRLERACANMQRHETAADTARMQAIDHCLVEVQARRRRRHCTERTRVYRLIPRLILSVARALDIRRQRHGAELLHHFQRPARTAELQEIHLADALDDLRIDALGNPQAAPWARRVAGSDHRQHLVIAHHTLDQNLDLAAGLFAREQTCLHHTRVVEHEQIPGLQQVGQIAEEQVADQAGVALQMQ